MALCAAGHLVKVALSPHTFVQSTRIQDAGEFPGWLAIDAINDHEKFVLLSADAHDPHGVTFGSKRYRWDMMF